MFMNNPEIKLGNAAATYDDQTGSAAIRALIAPRSVALIGASADPTRIGGRPIRSYREGGFQGQLFPINPNRDEIQGYKTYPSVDVLPQDIDLAVLALPAAQVPQTIEQCAKRGAKAAIVFSAGFAEIGGDGVRLQHELTDSAAKSGIRVLGPNCLGLFNVRLGHFPTFSSLLDTGLPLPGRVGLVTQSGAYGGHVVMQARERGIGVNIWVSTGNETDVGVPEIIEALAADPDTDVIACYLEGIRCAPAFLRALGAAHAARKPVILMKVGRSSVGAAAAASHTASLAGSDAVFDAAVRAFGVERVDTTDQMLDLMYAMSRAPLPSGNRLGIITISGGAGVMMADAAEKEGLAMPPMPEDTQRRLVAANPFCSPRNPVDVTAQVLNDFSLVRDNVVALIEEGNYDCFAAFFSMLPSAPSVAPKLKAAMLDGTKGLGQRPLALVVLAPPEGKAAYENEGFLVFEDPSRAVAAFGAMARVSARLNARPADDPPALPPLAKLLPMRKLSEADAKRLLAAASIPMLPERLVNSGDEAAQAFDTLGCPVAMKIVSPDIAHKTEIGGVVLNVGSAEAAVQAYDEIIAAAKAKAPKAHLEGVLVAPMANEGTELIVGARNDSVFGPVIMVGFGGIFVEVLRDVVLRVGAVSVNEARAMLRELKGYGLLGGVRGRPAADIDAAAEAIAALSVYAVANAGRFESIEVNPLLVRATGQGAVALDALVTPPEFPSSDALAFG
jgi:acyl-CoA synthetase (NDP forming)